MPPFRHKTVGIAHLAATIAKLTILEQAADRGRLLALIFRGPPGVVTLADGRAHLLECDLADAHERIERYRQHTQVADLQGDGSPEAGIDIARGAVNDNPQPPNAAAALESRHQISRHLYMLQRGGQNELS